VGVVYRRLKSRSAVLYPINLLGFDLGVFSQYPNEIEPSDPQG
jgi:hypothetical protein